MAHAVVVVGAGAAGMGAALELQKRGLAPLVIEAEDRAGGKLGTESRQGFLMERAALGLLDRTGELAELCGRLGVVPSPASPAASLRFLERDGKVHALPRGLSEALGSRLLSAREKLSLLGEPAPSRSSSQAGWGRPGGSWATRSRPASMQETPIGSSFGPPSPPWLPWPRRAGEASSGEPWPAARGVGRGPASPRFAAACRSWSMPFRGGRCRSCAPACARSGALERDTGSRWMPAGRPRKSKR